MSSPRTLVATTAILLLLTTPTSSVFAKAKEPEPDEWVELRGERFPLFSMESLRPRRRVPPEYPKEEKRRGLQENTMAMLLIDEQGKVAELRMLVSEPSPAFGIAAEECLRKWKFRKLPLEGKPTPYLFKAAVLFRISGR